MRWFASCNVRCVMCGEGHALFGEQCAVACSVQSWRGRSLVCCGRPTHPTPLRSHPWCVRGMCPRPHLHAVRDSHVHVDHGARAGQGCCLPTCARSSPGCVGGDYALGVPASHTPTHVPTVVCACDASPAPPARCPPLSYVYRLRGEGGKGVLPTNMWPLLPWVCGWAFCCGRHS